MLLLQKPKITDKPHELTIQKRIQITKNDTITYDYVDVAKVFFCDEQDNLNQHFKFKKISYLDDYVCLDSAKKFLKNDIFALSAWQPVDFIDIQKNSENLILQDIIPSGNARRFLIKHYNINQENLYNQHHLNYFLLKNCCSAPIGNIRIKESLEELKTAEPIFVDKKNIINEILSDELTDAVQSFSKDSRLSIGFNSHAYIIGSSSGTGGDSPKILITEWQDNRYSVYCDKTEGAIKCKYIVKYPRRNTELDRQILQAEYVYYNCLNEFGFSTMDCEKLKFEKSESNQTLSLWMPRFDVVFDMNGIGDGNGIKDIFAMDSIYSFMNETCGYLNHFDIIDKLFALGKENNERSRSRSHSYKNDNNNEIQYQAEEQIVEWIKRDILNVAFGNVDNHGRNSSILRGDGTINLSPIYDFAPMKADNDMIVRTIIWGRNYELAGQIDYQKIIEYISDRYGKQLGNRIKMEVNNIIGKLPKMRDYLLSHPDFPHQLLKQPRMNNCLVFCDEKKLQEKIKYDFNFKYEKPRQNNHINIALK